MKTFLTSFRHLFGFALFAVLFLPCGANAAINYLVIQTIPNGSKTSVTASIKVSSSCPSGYTMHTYNHTDGIGFEAFMVLASSNSVWINGNYGSISSFCVIGVPASINVNPPLTSHSSCALPPTAQTTLTLNGSMAIVNGCTVSNRSGVGFLLPDGYAIAAMVGNYKLQGIQKFFSGAMKNGVGGFVWDIANSVGYPTALHTMSNDLAMATYSNPGVFGNETYSGIPFCVNGNNSCISHTYTIGY